MTRPRVLSRIGEGARARARRVGVLGVSPAIGVMLIGAQLLAVLLCVLVITGWRGPSVKTAVAGLSYWPWQSLVTMLAFGMVAVTLSVAAARSTLPRRLLLSGATLVLTLRAADALPLAAGRPWLVAGAILCTVVGLTIPASRAAGEVIRFIAAFAPFAMGLVGLLRSTPVDQALAALDASRLTPYAAIALSLLAVYAVASAVDDQRERSARLMTWHVTRRAVVVAAALKLALMVALYLHLTGDFLGGPASWAPRLNRPLTWLHAVVVAGIIAFVAVGSRRSPVAKAGFTPRLAVLAVCLGIMQVSALLTLLVMAVVNAVNPRADTNGLFAFPNWVIDHGDRVQLGAMVLVLASALVTVAVRRTLTTGVYLWCVAGTWLIPPLLGIAFAANGTRTAWATPGQVETVLTVGVLVMVVSRQPPWATPRALLGLVLIPLVVLHVGDFWPGSWMQRLTQVLVVAAVVIALWLNPPPLSSDRRRNERTRALRLAGNLTILVLYVYLLNDATLTGGLGSSTTVAWLWLGVPVTAVLTARVAGREAVPRTPSPAQVPQATPPTPAGLKVLKPQDGPAVRR